MWKNKLCRNNTITFINLRHLILFIKCYKMSTAGKTRTKDKYRIVYTELQKVELEKEFLYNQYITIQRKSELAACIGLTDRQVKIWFQNRRAKDRKSRRKHEQMVQSDQSCHEQVPSNSSIFKSYPGPIGNQFALAKNPVMGAFCQSESASYDYHELPHSTFFDVQQTCLAKDVPNVTSLQRHHM